MARPIKETPVLKGSDAVRFSTKISKNEKNLISESELKRMRENYAKFRIMN